MTRHVVFLALIAMLVYSGHPSTAPRKATVRVIDKTTLAGETDPRMWKQVLELLPIRPSRIQVLDLDTLSPATRGTVEGVDAFVLAGHKTIVVVRQGATLRQAELGDAIDRLILASLVWHELAHVFGSDEETAFQWEQALWRRFMNTGRVDAATAMAYIDRLEEERSKARGRPDVLVVRSVAAGRQVEGDDGD